MEDRACDWVEGARRYYDRTRDIDEIREIWPVIVSQMNYFLRSRGPRGLVLAREWEAWGNPLGYVTCEGTGLNAFTCKALRDASYLGGVIGEKRQAAEFDRTATEISAAINSTLWDEQAGTYYSCYAPSGAIEGDPRVPAAWMPRASQLKVENCLAEPTAFCALMALDQGVVPATRVRAVTEYLMAARHQPAHMMYYYYLFKQMYGLDQPSLDTEILQTIRQKWKPMVDSPWQTSWEEFQGGSKAHIYGMFPGYFLSAYVLGVRPDGPMWAKRIIVEPHLGDLSAASGAVVTEYGAVAVSWKVAADRLEFRVGVPQGVTAALRIPEMGPQATLTIDGKAQTTRTNGRFVVRELGSGEHSGLVVVIR
jgi:hypothetical protein